MQDIPRLLVKGPVQEPELELMTSAVMVLQVVFQQEKVFRLFYQSQQQQGIHTRQKVTI